ncbi:MAG: DapH/DapD/GlmU-related protein [Planctomycetota bacterium]
MTDRQVHEQTTAYSSPWSRGARVRMAVWWTLEGVLYRWSPKPFSGWRARVLRWFGAKIGRDVFLSETSRVRLPWHLEMGDNTCLGEHTEVYNLGRVIVEDRATVAQHVYLCAGTHDFEQEHRPLVTAPIVIGEDAFIGAKVIILPGVKIGAGCIIGAGSVVTKDTKPWHIYAGNPARLIRERPVPRPRDTPQASDRPDDPA